MSPRRPYPHELYDQARAEQESTGVPWRERYLELMREHGHVRRRFPGEPRHQLPCQQDRP